MDRIRIIGINLIVFFVAGNVIYWAIPTVRAIVDGIGKSDYVQARAIPLALAGYAWAGQHNLEWERLTTQYKSFIGWRRRAFQGQVINVEGTHLQRRTVNASADGTRKAYFFGGSTMWGYHADEAGTIPSQFAALTRIHSENFGENGWTARQSLAQLIELLQEGHRPEIVVFYDGINETFQKCRREHGPTSHALEYQIMRVLGTPYSSSISFTHYFAPMLEVARLFNRTVSASSRLREFDCDAKPEKAAAIAENLTRDWQFARELVEAYGGKFIGILQPVSFFSVGTRLEGVELEEVHKRQFETVYPLLREQVARRGRFHDFVAILDRDELLYTDPYHVSPKANGYIARKIAAIVSSMETKP